MGSDEASEEDASYSSPDSSDPEPSDEDEVYVEEPAMKKGLNIFVFVN